MSRVIFICHGATASQLAGRFPLPTDALLASSSELIHGLEPLPVPNLVFSAPELQSLESARLLGPVPIVDERLRDTAFGAWAGQSFEEIEVGWPGQLREWIESVEFRPPGGESFMDVWARVRTWTRPLDDRTGTTIVVASASVIRAAICILLDAPPQLAGSFDIEPFGRVTTTTDGKRWKLRLAR